MVYSWMFRDCDIGIAHVVQSDRCEGDRGESVKYQPHPISIADHFELILPGCCVVR